MHQSFDGLTDSDDCDSVESSRVLLPQLRGAQSPMPNCSLLPIATLEHVAQYIKSDKCNRIIVMQGAGVSTAAGIPDFRGPNGLYKKLDHYGLPYPEAIFDIEFFKERPEPFFSLAKELFPGNFRPTLSHFFVRLLHEKQLLKRCFTQNIDVLERVAGLSPDVLVEAHGSFASGTCLTCERRYAQDYVYDFVNDDKIPYCESETCEGVVKPDIVFFGEPLPDRFHNLASEDFGECDLLIVMGTSLKVAPFNQLVTFVDSKCVRLMLNLEVPKVSFFNWSSTRNQDVKYIGTCDEGCRILAQYLGWEEDLDKLMSSVLQTLESERQHKKFLTANHVHDVQKESELKHGDGTDSKTSPKDENVPTVNADTNQIESDADVTNEETVDVEDELSAHVKGLRLNDDNHRQNS
eukprot:CFRG6310T1